MRAYELMVILDPDLEERTVQPSLDTYLNVVRKDGGSEPATVKELDRQLTLNESVLRTKVIRPDAR